MIRQGLAIAMTLLLQSAAAHAQTTAPADRETTSLNLTAYAELLRSDVRAEKVAILTEVMGFTDEESAAFWPIYRAYDAQMSKLGDERVALVKEYAANYTTMTDAAADALGAKALDLDGRRRAALADCYERVKKALAPKTALRFLQVEHQLLLIIDLQIAASLPIAR